MQEIKIIMQNFGQKTWKQETVAFLSSRASHFFFSFEMSFVDFLSLHPVCCPCGTKGLSAPACLPFPQFPEISVDISI